MSNYLPNEDILLILGECHRNYRRAARVYDILIVGIPLIGKFAILK